ncbi:MAG: UDP-3-O-(3-hydroxymyristoyl)glucosamine N-acyltransferase, partial [Gammaproteobacteria bacterium]
MYTVAQIAEKLSASFQGDGGCLISSIAPLETANTGQITFLDNRKYQKYLSLTKASAVILTEQNAKRCHTNAIITPKPYLAYAKVAELFLPKKQIREEIHPTAIIASSAKIAKTASIGANVVIGENVVIADHVVIEAGCIIQHDCQIGKNTHLYPHVTFYHDVIVGDNCIIHTGVVLGADGFGFAESPEGWYKIPQLGGVRVGHHVEIGANTTIDRGAIANTTIGNGVKLDNQIQVGHNVVIGDHTIIAGCTAIAGSAVIGQYCMIGGGARIAGHLKLTDGVILTATAAVPKSIEQPGVYSSGFPVEDYQTWRKNVAVFAHLTEMKDK